MCEKTFWQAIDMASKSTRPDDVMDVGRFVASRGERSVAEFLEQLEGALLQARTAGLVDVLLGDATAADGRAVAELDEHEVDQFLQALVLRGSRWFGMLLDDPDNVQGIKGGALVDLRQVIDEARQEPGIDAAPLWAQRPGDRRRDGSPWIWITVATGVGVPGLDASPWKDHAFFGRFDKAALLCSLDDSWRAWRSGIGAKKLDVTVEYWWPGDEPERVEVLERGRSTDVTVYRDANRVMAEGDLVELGDHEASAALELVRNTLAPA